MSYSPCHHNQHTEGVGGSIFHKTIIVGLSGPVQCKVSQWRVPAEQLGHQGEAGLLESLVPAGNWLEERDWLCSCSGSNSPGFNFNSTNS